MYQRPHHNAILGVLHALDAELLERAECFFGGGTAIVLQLGEFRESVDIDFLCASQDGYRLLREITFDQGLRGLLRAGAELGELRELRSDQYGLRAAIAHDRAKIKFEIVREARIELAGKIHPDFGVPTLARDDMYAEKLLANADRWQDAGVLSRDIIDLSMMMSVWGGIPASSWKKVESAYGDSARKAYGNAVKRIRDPDWLANCMKKMAIDAAFADQILAPHGGPLPRTPSPFD